MHRRCPHRLGRRLAHAGETQWTAAVCSRSWLTRSGENALFSYVAIGCLQLVRTTVRSHNGFWCREAFVIEVVFGIRTAARPLLPLYSLPVGSTHGGVSTPSAGSIGIPPCHSCMATPAASSRVSEARWR